MMISLLFSASQKQLCHVCLEVILERLERRVPLHSSPMPPTGLSRLCPGRAQRLPGNAVVPTSYVTTGCSGHHRLSLSMPGPCKDMPIGGSGMREIRGLLTRIVPGLFSPDCQHTSLHEPSASHPCLLIHHLAHHLARQGIAILRFFNQQPTAQELLH